jgi:hypothetical protein
MDENNELQVTFRARLLIALMMEAVGVSETSVYFHDRFIYFRVLIKIFEQI